jgi:hypothetical protein
VWRYLRLFSHCRLPLQTLRTLYASHRVVYRASRLNILLFSVSGRTLQANQLVNTSAHAPSDGWRTLEGDADV